MTFRTTPHELDGPPMSGQVRPVTEGYILEGCNRHFATLEEALEYQATHLYDGERPTGRARRPQAGIWTPVSYEPGGTPREEVLTHLVQAIALLVRAEGHLAASAPHPRDGEFEERTAEFEDMTERFDKLFWSLQAVTMHIESAPGLDPIPALAITQRSGRDA